MSFIWQKAVAGTELKRARVRTQIFRLHSELEGWLCLPDGRETFVTSSRKNHICAGTSKPAASFSTPAGSFDF